MSAVLKGQLAVLALFLAIGATGAEPRRVLLLHSFGREFEPFSTFSENFRTELAKQSPEPLDFFDVALETARFDGAEDGPFVDYLLALFAQHRPNLVVPMGGPAVRFAQKYRNRLFPGTPMLLAAVDDRHLQVSTLTTNDAVIGVHHNTRLVLEDILRLLPDTTNIVVVIGDSPLERFWVEELQTDFEPFTNRVQFSWFNKLSFDEITRRVAALPPQSAIFYGQMTVDAEGVPHTEERALAELHSLANAPIFSVHDYQLGRGIVGGPLIPVVELSRQSAVAAAKILRGEPAGNIRPPAVGAGRPAYDWRELQRWQIPEERLPTGSFVQLREPTTWEKHKGRLVVAASLCVLEGVLIFVLVASLQHRRRVERSLAENENRLKAILNTAVEGIITIDERGTIESVNAATQTLFGYAPAEAIGQNLRFLIPDAFGPEREAPVGSNLTQPGSMTGAGRELTGRRKDGSVFPAELALSEIVLANRRVFTGFVRDLTERREAEQASREFSGRLLHAQEMERARLGRELHDDISQRLARLAIDAGRAEAGHNGARRSETMRELRDGLVRLSEDVHTLSYQLHPAVLEDLGLTEALKVECERFSRLESIPVDLKVEPIAKVSNGAGLCLFRVAQEALRNIARHARADSARVSLRALEGGLQLVVADTGAGFEPARQKRRPSLGLASMRERVRLAGGELDIESSPGDGTTVSAWVPLKGEHK